MPEARPVPRGRLVLLLGGGVAMLLGLDAGLLLLGLPAPVTTERLPEVHGQLMLIGFLGTVIALERAVALRRPGASAHRWPPGSAPCCCSLPCPRRSGRWSS